MRTVIKDMDYGVKERKVCYLCGTLSKCLIVECEHESGVASDLIMCKECIKDLFEEAR